MNLPAKAIRISKPVGSPYGFIDADWELISSRKSNRDCLYVVLGCKFESSYYELEELIINVQNMFKRAVKHFNEKTSGDSISLQFVPLQAGYGEHLFNQIARDIISSDIAVFEISDSAPNVYIEIGVALTWGSSVLLIKSEGCESPPSNISGHTYVKYRDSTENFISPGHEEMLYRMVEHAIKKKRSR